MSPTYGVLGVGALGHAVVTGLVDGVTDPPVVVVSPRGTERSTALSRAHPTVEVAADNQGVVDAADVVLVCLREGDAPGLADLEWRPDQVVVSAVAGLDEPALRALVAPVERVARAVPMVAVATRAWATPVRPPLPEALALFERTGGAIAVDSDEEYDAIFTGLGTVAPFFSYLGVVADFLVAHGTAPADARTLLARAFAGIGAQLAAAESPDFDVLVREHATPGGGNEQLNTLIREAGVHDATRAALDEVFHRQTGGHRR